MKKNNFKILWVTPKWTLPIEDGARVATKAILQPLLKLNPDIDYLALAGVDEQIDEKSFKAIFPVKNIFILKRAAHLSGLAKKIDYLRSFFKNPFFPLTFSRYKLNVTEILKQSNPDLIVLDGLHCAIPFLKLKKHPPLILRAHNVEKDLWLSSANNTRNPFFKYFFKYQASLVAKLEKKIITKCQQVFAISPEDQTVFREISGKNILELPVGLDFSTPLDFIPSEKIQLLFLGKLDWAPNSEGLKWFLTSVWPHLSKDRFHLTIAGSGESSWLLPYQNDHLTFLGRVADVKPVYKKSHMVIVPIFFGSGTRIKVLEASRFKRATISTQLGIAGSPLTENDAFFSGESAPEWINAFNKMSMSDIKSKADVAFNLCATHLDEIKVAEEFIRELEDGLTRKV